MASFSVIVPTFNQRALVVGALESVERQSRRPDEVIVVDDGSTDGTSEMLRAHFSSATVIAQQNRGQGFARNAGIAAAHGDWLCFLDHDDLWHPEKLARLERYLSANPLVEAVHHPVWLFSAPGGPEHGFGLGRDFVAESLDECLEQAAVALPVNDMAFLHIAGRSFERLLDGNVAMPTAVAVRRETAIRAGCFPAGHAEDWRFAQGVARLTEWETLPERLAFARLHREQTTNAVSSAYLLAALVEAWWGGRPDPGAPLTLSETRCQLVSHGGVYRTMVRSFLKEAARAHDWRLALLDWRLGAALLPRARDRVAIGALPRSWRSGRGRAMRSGVTMPLAETRRSRARDRPITWELGMDCQSAAAPGKGGRPGDGCGR